MSSLLKVERSCLPVTALKNVKILESRILLAGQGPSIYLIEEQTGKQISSFRVFESQAIHGISALQESDCQYDSSFILLWGGPLFQVVKLTSTKLGSPIEKHHEISLVPISPVRSAGDWILDASFAPFEAKLELIALRAALITAHNALVHVKIILASNIHHHTSTSFTSLQVPSELKSILYSANIEWLSPDHILIGSGTVFGEVIVWSCFFHEDNIQPVEKETTRTHYVLTGHEGSVFGVHISQCHFVPWRSKPLKVLASCSDDRTIRVWDISDLERVVKVSSGEETLSGSKARSTGFHETDEILKSVDSWAPLAMAWGHVSRIWDVKFLASFNFKGITKLVLVSRGEDATLQLWDLVLDRNDPENSAGLLRLETFSNHSGKNIWSWTTSCLGQKYQVFCGGADGSVVSTHFGLGEQTALGTKRWTAKDVPKLSNVPMSGHASLQNLIRSGNDQIKQYDFISNNEFLTLTQNGFVLLGTIAHHSQTKVARTPSSEISQEPPCVIHWETLGLFDDIKSYSIIAANAEIGIAVFGGVNGMIQCYYHRHRRFYDICKFTGKVTGLFLLSGTEVFSEQSILGSPNGLFSLLITLANTKVAYAITICSIFGGSEEKLTNEGPYKVPLFETFDITSALHLPHRLCLVVGSRTGGYAFYDTTKRDQNVIRMVMCTRNLFHKDAITSIKSLPSPVGAAMSSLEYIQTCGRDGMFRVSSLTFQSVSELFTLPSMKTVHESSLPLGPNLEGVCISPVTHDILIYGFRGKDFVVWNETKQQELMIVDCGGAHRTWSYSPPSSLSDSGTFLWTKASTFNLFSQTSLPSRVIQPGGHGREIKSMSVSNSINIGNGTRHRLVATGAEDTTIRISSLPYHSGHLLSTLDNDFIHLQTLKKHTTGIQHLLWSHCSTYLFSSGGCSEFFVWRISHVPAYGLAVCCEAVCPISDDDSSSFDLRITSFDILEIDSTMDNMRQNEKQFLIAMAFSNSYVKLYLYSSQRNYGQFTALSHAPYTTNTCLTSISFVSHGTSLELYTSSTSGHVSSWSLSHLGQPRYPIRNGILFLDPSIPQCLSDRASKQDIYWHARKAVHQNSVKCMLPIANADNESLVIAGGDDNSLSLTRFWVAPPSSKSDTSRTTVMATLKIPKAHASTVTAIAILPPISTSNDVTPEFKRSRHLFQFTLLSSGNDQRLKVWEIRLDIWKAGVEGIEVRRIANEPSSVADVSGMDVFVDGAARRVILCGVGMEVWTVDPDGILCL